MDKKWSTNQLLHATFTIIVILIIVIALIINLPDDDKEDESDWTEYPYVIPGTDLRFPDVEGETEGEKWISIGMKLELSGHEELHIVLLYHPNFKSTYLFNRGEPIYEENIRGNMVLKEGVGGMTFEHDGYGMNDTIEPTGDAFSYDLNAWIPSNDNFTDHGEKIFLNLTLESNKPPATLFDGQVQLNHRYYNLFSLTDCYVRGSVEENGITKNTEGSAWFEHQWGDFGTLDWDWFSVWLDEDIELKIVHLSSGTHHLDYIMYVGPQGEITTIEGVSIDVTSKHRGYGHIWDITSQRYDIDLSITVQDEMTVYGAGYIVGFGSIEGTMDDMDIDTEIYIESTISYLEIPLP